MVRNKELLLIFSMVPASLYGGLQPQSFEHQSLYNQRAIHQELTDDSLVSQEQRVNLISKKKKARYWQLVARGATIVSLTLLAAGYCSEGNVWPYLSIQPYNPPLIYSIFSIVLFGASIMINNHGQKQLRGISDEHISFKNDNK